MTVLSLVAALVAVSLALADDKSPRRETFQVTGLFRPDREADFAEAMKGVADVKLVSVDYKNAEATFEFVPARAFPGARPEQLLARLDERVRGASRHTFGVKARAEAREKLERVEIRVAGCHCKACDLAAYEAVYRLPGVERATACFRDGLVTALIDPAKADRAKLIEALKRREVDVRER
jgi:copper chaperone CopZ